LTSFSATTTDICSINVRKFEEKWPNLFTPPKVTYIVPLAYLELQPILGQNLVSKKFFNG
jgi:hypothetical protein